MVKAELMQAQKRAHHWGRLNRVTFDAGKEHFHVVHPDADDYVEFKMLGTLLDSSLIMRPLIDSLLSKDRPKARALVRMRHMYSLETLLNQFKTHVWNTIEYNNEAIIMARPSESRRLDSMQRGFLHEIGCDEATAFISYDFAPPSMRRAIGILGFIHKRVLGLCHPALCQALPFSGLTGSHCHSKALDAKMSGVIGHWNMYFRSLWSYILIYNRLPEGLIATQSVSTFQGKLTQLVKTLAESSDPNWREAFQSCEDNVRFFQMG